MHVPASNFSGNHDIADIPLECHYYTNVLQALPSILSLALEACEEVLTTPPELLIGKTLSSPQWPTSMPFEGIFIFIAFLS